MLNVLNMLPWLRVIGLAGAPNKPVLGGTGVSIEVSAVIISLLDKECWRTSHRRRRKSPKKAHVSNGG